MTTTIEALLPAEDDAAGDVAELLRKIGNDAAAARQQAEQANSGVQRLNGTVADHQKLINRHEQTLYGPTGRTGLVDDMEEVQHDLKNRNPEGMVPTKTMWMGIAAVGTVMGVIVSAVVGVLVGVL